MIKVKSRVYILIVVIKPYGKETSINNVVIKPYGKETSIYINVVIKPCGKETSIY